MSVVIILGSVVYDDATSTGGTSVYVATSLLAHCLWACHARRHLTDVEAGNFRTQWSLL